ncbi:MAG TPA: substrate-binding domain-containing protein [Candidatus Competibacter sp.]|nr:substrate-binding domain-containing protein [Candidatus Competibacter sp.]
MFKKEIILAMSLVATSMSAQSAADYITVAGGLVPIPLMIKAGEQLASKNSQFKPPHILYNDTTVGFQLFCAGDGLETPSINTGTRQIKPAEFESCRKNGVNEIVQFELGRDAFVAAQVQSGQLKHLSRKELFLAIAKEVPDRKDNAKLIPNPYKTWKDIDPALPDLKINVLGPEQNTGLYQTFLKGILLPGCKQAGLFKDMESNQKEFEAACKNTRKDGAFTEYRGHDNAIQGFKNNPDSLGIVSLTAAVKEGLKKVQLDNMDPTFTSISRDMYELTYPLLVTVKKSHINRIPGLKEYLAELTSEDAIGTTGYFYKMGVIPLPLVERQQVRADVQALKVIFN